MRQAQEEFQASLTGPRAEGAGGKTVGLVTGQAGRITRILGKMRRGLGKKP